MRRFRILFSFLAISIAFHVHAESPEDRLTLGFIGDIMAHNVNYLIPDYSVVYREVQSLLRSDDLTFGNLEFPVDPTLPQATYPRFNNHPSYVRAVAEAGVEVFSLANNHSADQGDLSIFKTLESLEALQKEMGYRIHYAGLRSDTDRDFEPLAIELKGWRIGYMAVTQFQNLQPRKPYVHEVDYRDEKEADDFIKYLREKTSGYDLFIVSYHGGYEYARKPNDKKREFFLQLLRAGVHIVHGHHPHVLQPVERVWEEGLIKVILHSTGNFISGQGYRVDPLSPYEDWSYTGDSAIFRMNVRMTTRGATVTSVEPVFIANYTLPTREVVIEPLETLSEKIQREPWKQYYSERLEIMESYDRDEEILTRKQIRLLK